jgi:hypothetical protein
VNDSKQNIVSEPNATVINKNLSNFNFKSLLMGGGDNTKVFIRKQKQEELNADNLNTIIKQLDFRYFEKDEDNLFKSNGREYVKFINKFNKELEYKFCGEM